MPTYNNNDFKVTFGTDNLPLSAIQDGVASDGSPIWSLAVSANVVSGGGGDASAANQVITNTEIGAINETAPTTDTDASGLNGLLKRLNAKVTALTSLFPTSIGQKTSVNSLSVALASDQVLSLSNSTAQIGKVGGNTAKVSAYFQRPNDSIAYAAKDAVASSASTPTYLTFTNLPRISGGSGYITKALIVSGYIGISLRLWLYANLPLTIDFATPTQNIVGVVDNTQFTLRIENTYVGYIDFPPLATEGDGGDGSHRTFAQWTGAPIAFVASDTNLYGLLEVRSAFDASGGGDFFIELTAEQN
jgi:hypothetical protein